MDDLGVARVAEYFARIGQHLPHKAQHASFATYAFGILADGERKSVEPIAARACADPVQTQRAHDHLLHFLLFPTSSSIYYTWLLSIVCTVQIVPYDRHAYTLLQYQNVDSLAVD